MFKRPIITSVSPSKGSVLGGTILTIKGSNFVSGYTSVTFDGSNASNIVVDASGSTITCITPTGSKAGPVDIIVNTPFGSYTLQGKFRLFKRPIITSVSPSKGSVLGGTILTIKGSNFVSGYTSVTFDGSNASNIVVDASGSTITCITPAGSKTGSVNVIVTNPYGSATSSYTFVTPYPTITSVSPSKGSTSVAGIITIYGNNFISGRTNVYISGIKVSNITINNSGNTITCTTPVLYNIGYVSILVTTQYGSYTSTNTYYLNGTTTVGTVNATLTFGGVTLSNPSTATTIQDNIKPIIANALNVDASNVTINSVTKGSIVVDYTITDVSKEQEIILNNISATNIDTSSIVNYISEITGVNVSAITIASEARELVPTDTIVSNVCFPAGTPVMCDQGEISIEKMNPEIHTIRGKKIVAITRTITQDKHLICFEKDSLHKNIPSQKTLISKNHKIFYKGEMKKAKEFVCDFENVKKVKYTGEILYNVLMEDNYKMLVNNLICETLDTKNDVAKLYRYYFPYLNIKDQQNLINKINQYVIKNKVYTSKK